MAYYYLPSIPTQKQQRMKINNPARKTMALLAFSLFCSLTFAQKTVSGRIVDTNGEPMAGVTVLIKGTTAGGITDGGGLYSLNNVRDDATLIARFIGYLDQEEVVGTRTVVNFIMTEDAKALDEVVVVGYGTQRKADLTGSIGSVSPKDITLKGTSTMMESLQGTVPGVSITQTSSRAGGGYDIQIRGIQSITKIAKPLYVVDGIVVSDIQFLNPADIERVDILKDASSTAIYGSRASQGVVMVTTKTAKTQGGQTIKPTISYDGYYGTRRVARTPDFMDGMDFMQYRFSRYTSRIGRASKDGSVAYQMTPANLQITLLTNYVPEKDGDGNYMVGKNHWDYYKNKFPAYTPSKVEQMMANGDYYDWMDMVTQEATQQNHFVSVSGASAGTNYHFGMGYQQDEGIFLKDNENRFNLKAAIDTKIADKWTAGISINLARTINEFGSDNAVSNAFWSNPYFIPRDDNGELYLQSGIASVLGSSTGAQFSSMINPLIDMENTLNGAQKLHVLGNIYLQFSPIKDLLIKSVLSPSVYTGREHYYAGVKTQDRNSAGTDRASVESTNMFDYTWDNQINYAFVKDDHSLNAMGLFSLNKYSSEYFNQFGEDFPNNTTYYNMGNAATIIAPQSGYTEYSMMSYAARLNYAYKGKYMVTGTIRWDGSSRFAEGNRWGSFPSAAVAWRASEEDFIKTDWLNNLKLRLSYGISGNNNVGNYETATAPSSTAYYAFGSTMAYGYGPNGIVNSNLRWEKTGEWNLGVDLSVLNNRINITADLYDKLSVDLLLDRKLAIEAGGGATVMDNIGKVRNRGFELSLNTVNVQTRDLRFETTFGFALNKNTIEALYGEGVTEDLGNAWFVGSPVSVYYNYELGGIVNDKPLTVTLPEDIAGFMSGGASMDGVKGQTVTFDHAYEFYYKAYGWYEGQPIVKDRDWNGVIDADDKTIIGKALPDWTGSLTMALTYKNWDLSATAYAKQGYMVMSPFLRLFQGYNDRGRMHINMDYYIPANTPVLLSDGSVGVQAETHYGSYPYPTDALANGGVGDYYGGTGGSTGLNYHVDASYVKVKNIVLGYTMPRRWMDPLGISSLRIYGNILNPFVFTKYKGFDPEWAGAALSAGGPSTVTYQVGVNLKF